MAHIVADRVKDSTTTTGASTITLSGTAPTGYQTFGSTCAVGDTFFYAISSAAGAEWEVGLGTLLTSVTFSRDIILDSSNSDNVVTLSAGTKDVFITVPAKMVQNAGQIVAQINGLAMP